MDARAARCISMEEAGLEARVARWVLVQEAGLEARVAGLEVGIVHSRSQERRALVPPQDLC